MDIEKVSQYLDYYIKMNNPQYAVMLNGKWGCGKTYFIKNKIERWNKIQENNNSNHNKKKNFIKIFSRKKREENICIILKPIYISLNGLNSVSQISYNIKKELRPLLYSKGAQIAKSVLLGTLRVATKGAIDFNGDGNKDDISDIFDTDSIIQILSESNDSVEGNKVLIFDDLERCKIPTDEIFGYINNFVEHSNCKVIIIGEEDKIQKMYANNETSIEYKDFKEKLIGQTFSIKQNFKTIVNLFIVESNNQYLINNKKLIIDLFIASEVENLRIIKQFCSDFNRLIDSIYLDDFKQELIDKFIKNIIAYFTITYCEHKSGNNDIIQFQKPSYLASDKEKAINQSFKNKYHSILQKYSVVHSDNSVNIEDIIHFINNGYISDIQNIVIDSAILKQREPDDWEVLWEYDILDNETFKTKLKAVEDLFFNKKVDVVEVVLHISGIFLNVNSLKLTKYNEDEIFQKAKEHIDRISEQNKYLDKLREGAYRKQYRMLESPSMKELIEYSENTRLNLLENKRAEYCKNIWSNLKDEDVDQIFNIFKETIPSRNSNYEFTSIFEGIDVIETTSQIKKLSNKSKTDLILFLKYRYYLPDCGINGEIQIDFIKDLDSLKGIKDELKKNVCDLKYIDKLTANNLITTLQQCITKLEIKKSTMEETV